MNYVGKSKSLRPKKLRPSPFKESTIHSYGPETKLSDILTTVLTVPESRVIQHIYMNFTQGTDMMFISPLEPFSLRLVCTNLLEHAIMMDSSNGTIFETKTFLNQSPCIENTTNLITGDYKLLYVKNLRLITHWSDASKPLVPSTTISLNSIDPVLYLLRFHEIPLHERLKQFFKHYTS